MRNKLSLLVNFIGHDKLSGSLRNIVALGRKGSESLNALRGEGRKLEKQLRDVRRELAGSSGNVTALIDRERELERAIAETNARLERRKRLNSIEADRRRMVARGEELRQRGTDNMIGGAAMLAPFAIAIKSGMDYEKQLALLGQKTDLSARQTKAFGTELLRVAHASKQMPDTIIQGADFLASKGLGVDAIKATMPAIGQFATAWDADVVDSAKAAYANILSLKVPANQAARALEIMGVAGKQGGFEVRDMAQHFPVLASQIATLGGDGLDSVASLSAALQVLEAKTGDGAMAANDLGNMLRFATTAQGQKNFRKFGINIVDELKKAEREGGDSIERLAQLINQVTGGDNAKIAELITDTQAGRGALNLVQSIEKYREIRDEAFAAQGVTAKEFARMSKTSAANWEATKGSLAGLSMTLGTHVLPAATKFFDVLARITNGVADWAEANPTAAKTLLMIVGGLGAARIGIGAMQFALGGLFGPLASGIALWKKYKLLGSLALTFPKVAMGVRLLGLALRFMLGPVGLAITVIGLLAFAVYKNWDKIKAAFDTGVDWVKNLMNGMPDWLKNVGKMMMAGLLSAINPLALGTRLIQMAKNGITAFKNYLGIKSPSRVFMALGAHTADGLARGIDRGGRRAVGSMSRLAAGVTAAGAMSLTPVAASASATPAMQSAAAGFSLTLNIYQQPGESAEKFAERVVALIERKAGIKARRGYQDEGED